MTERRRTHADPKRDAAEVNGISVAAGPGGHTWT